MAVSSFFISFAFFLLFSGFYYTATFANEDFQFSTTPNFPKVQAQKLIQGLNLFPKNAVNKHGDEALLELEDSDAKIVEKRFQFPGLAYAVNGPSAGDLGHHAGYYRLPNSHAARMFYLFFESRGEKDDPVVIWLTGGPGCSSELAVFYENGPFHISKNLSLEWNDYGWDKVSNLLFVDQPIGTGFSYTSDDKDIRHNEEAVSNDLYDFLQEFFKEHPQYAKNDFYITGESYAGHYIPAFAARVHQGNKAKEGILINLKGFAIGNGLTDPEIQYPAYIDYALEHKLISNSDYKELNEALPGCTNAIKRCGTDGQDGCLEAYYVCNSLFNSILQIAGSVNYYDIRKQCQGDLCYDFSNISTVYDAMVIDWMRNLEVGIPALLDDGINLLIYAGEYDLICNWLGNSRWVHAMEWSRQKEFNASQTIPFSVDGKEAGQLKNHGPLTFLKVHDAGHMVPMDQPKVSLQMLKAWMQGKLAIPEEQGRS